MVSAHPASSRRDLAALIAPFNRALLAEEKQVLTEYGASMWEYIILTALREHSSSNQGQLAQRIRHDKSRIIADIDRLEARGLVTRSPGSDDRRARVIAITTEGDALQRTIQAAIQDREDTLLVAIPPEDRRALYRLLEAIHPMVTPRDNSHI
ncbi:MAG: MarR family winged helix-turn-helix transcriptional regulator [Microbacterium sp.]|uniref:MarR family winged helix-turn-helix transcriptional regulator n=1 Tax=Microbacterium sp. TaxID=51671 RepID=UPI003F94C021